MAAARSHSTRGTCHHLARTGVGRRAGARSVGTGSVVSDGNALTPEQVTDLLRSHRRLLDEDTELRAWWRATRRDGRLPDEMSSP